jgi:hypothetical protein
LFSRRSRIAGCRANCGIKIRAQSRYGGTVHSISPLREQAIGSLLGFMYHLVKRKRHGIIKILKYYFQSFYLQFI